MSKVIRPKGRKKFPEGVAIGVCSLCEKPDATFGQQYPGGIRWCRQCIRQSLGWVQFSADQRTQVMGLLNQCAADDRQLLEECQTMPPEHWHNHALGESRRRLIDASIKEAGGKGILP